MNKNNFFVARIDNSGRTQSIYHHLIQVAEKCWQFCGKVGLEKWGYAAGILHDIGKYSDDFQKYIRNAVQNGAGRGSVHHSIVGAVEAIKRYGPQVGKILAYAIAGHHSGLPNGKKRHAGDRSALSWRLENEIKNIGDPSRWKEEVGDALPEIDPEQLAPWFQNRAGKKEFAFGTAFLIRMIFSALVDADRLDAESFSEPEKAQLRKYPSLAELKEEFDRYMRRFDDAEPTPINRRRAEVLNACRRAAELEPGIFELTVPTGGGKTLSSMAFALNHAVKHGMDRIIYVIPYTSIIEQNAGVFRDAFGELGYAVVEHHSNFDPQKAHLEGEDLTRYELATENWDAPIIVTTNVQFFESLFDYRASRCRKLHNIANSVVILDEVQMLPVEFLQPCVEAIRELTEYYHTTVVLCSATQPALQRKDEPNFRFNGLDIPPEHRIIKNPRRLYETLRRVQFLFLGDLPDDQLAENILKYPQALCILNTRKHARKIFNLIGEGENTYHLSSLMCPEHRSRTIEEIKDILAAGKPIRVVSTQLVEAGVDIDFPVVFRAIAGIDSIVQAAGRCNREGKLPEMGKVFVFNTSELPPGYLRRTAQDALEIITVFKQNFSSLEAIHKYFEIHYWGQKNLHNLDIEDILGKTAESLTGLDFPFREIGEKFRIIKQGDTYPVIIPYDSGAEELIEHLRRQPPNRQILRALQRYTVSVYRNEFEKIRRNLEVIKPADREDFIFPVLVNRRLYHPKLGLLIDESDLIDIDESII